VRGSIPYITQHPPAPLTPVDPRMIQTYAIYFLTRVRGTIPYITQHPPPTPPHSDRCWQKRIRTRKIICYSPDQSKFNLWKIRPNFSHGRSWKRCYEDVDMMSLMCSQVNPIKQNHVVETTKKLRRVRIIRRRLFGN